MSDVDVPMRPKSGELPGNGLHGAGRRLKGPLILASSENAPTALVRPCELMEAGG